MNSAGNLKHRQIDALTRRDFVRAAGGCSALTSGAIMSTLLNLKASNAAVSMASNFDGYRAMVCVFLFGGNDSFNMLVPREEAEYADYAAIRGNPAEGGLALAKEDLLPISAVNGRQFGLHPSMPELKSLYDANKCAMIANIGTLVRPTTIADYRSGRNLPTGLFSHLDHIRHWQTSIPQSRSHLTGWGGRMADIVTDTTNDNEVVSMNISLSGVATFETGRNVVPYVVQPGGATELDGYANSTNARDIIYRQVTDSVLDATYSDLLQKTYARTNRNSIDAAVQFNTAVGGVSLDTVFPESYLGNQLQMIARTIGARETLGQRRQIYFVTVGGWDHHDEVLNNQQGMLADVSQSLNAFYDATVELSVANDVVAYTVSDFGRTLSSNGNGSDHAWGGNQIVVGGSVNGGDIFGDYPASLLSDQNTDLDVGRGRVLPTLSVDEHAAELAMWYGIQNDGNLEAILPNIRNFYGNSATSRPVGFMQT